MLTARNMDNREVYLVSPPDGAVEVYSSLWAARETWRKAMRGSPEAHGCRVPARTLPAALRSVVIRAVAVPKGNRCGRTWYTYAAYHPCFGPRAIRGTGAPYRVAGRCGTDVGIPAHGWAEMDTEARKWASSKAVVLGFTVE